MAHGGRDIARVLRDGRGVDPLIRRFGRWFLGLELPLADFQVKPRAFEQLAFVRVALDHGPQRGGRRGEVAALQRLETALVHRDGFVVRRLPGRWRRRCGRRRRSHRLRGDPRRGLRNPDSLFDDGFSDGGSSGALGGPATVGGTTLFGNAGRFTSGSPGHGHPARFGHGHYGRTPRASPGGTVTNRLAGGQDLQPNSQIRSYDPYCDPQQSTCIVR